MTDQMAVPATGQVDPVTFEIVKNALDSVADQTALVLMRSAYSPIVRDSLDYSTAICDRHGQMLAQGLTLPIHLGSFPDAMRRLTEQYAGRMEPGDVFIMNDPYGGGVHLPDVYVIRPIFYDGVVEGFVATLAHQADIGGLTPGSNSIHSTELYQEGLRIPLVKLYEHGEPNETMFSLIEKNVRVPDTVIGDLQAQAAACRAGERAFTQLLDRYGAPAFRSYLEAIQDYAERAMRAAIRKLPDGVYRFTDTIDGLGENPPPIIFNVTITIDGDEVAIDWEGSSPQVKGGVNAPMPNTRCASYIALRSIIRQDIPNAQGYMRPIKTTAPLGSVVNPVLPGPCAVRGITVYRMVDCLLGALAQAVPDRVPAACEGGPTLFCVGGYHDGKPFVLTDIILGCRGGRPDTDGAEGVANLAANLSSPPIELVEAEMPLRARRYELIPDSGGAGKHRGGLAIRREWEMLADETLATIRSDRRTNPAYGLHGGKPGAPSLNVVNPGPNERILPVLPMEAVLLRQGDIYRHLSPGAGGFGDPFERDPARVLEDILDEKVTIDGARRDYGVVIDPATLTIDHGATAALRASLKAGVA